MKKNFFKVFLQGTFKLFSSEFLHYWLCKHTPLQRKKNIYIYILLNGNCVLKAFMCNGRSFRMFMQISTLLKGGRKLVIIKYYANIKGIL